MYGFSLICVWYMSLDSLHIQENLSERKLWNLYILCNVQLNLLVYLGTFFSVELVNSVHETPIMLPWHFSVHFFLQLKVIVCISGSATIHLLGINAESTEFQSNSTGFKWCLVLISDSNKLKQHNVI